MENELHMAVGTREGRLVYRKAKKLTPFLYPPGANFLKTFVNAV